MKKNAICALLLPIMAIFSTVNANAEDFSKFILNQSSLNSSCGNPVNTYEDVDPIENIMYTNSADGPIIKLGTLLGTYNPPNKESVGRAFINQIKDAGGIILTNTPMTFSEFLGNKRFYLDSGSYDDSNVWSARKVEEFPFTYDSTSTPHRKKYYLCLTGGFNYIQPFDMEPNASSCANSSTKDWCDYGPGKCKKGKDGEDEDGDGIEEIPPESEEHIYSLNVYKNLGDFAVSKKATATGVKEKESGIEFTLNFDDRTPPRIEGCSGGEFPSIGVNSPATTGDWYKVQGLKITDNSGDESKIGTCLVLGKIDTEPSTTWVSSENWVGEPPREITSGSETDYVIMPNSCHGIMRYSIFAWDEAGNLNPGDPGIIEDSPETCYGLKDPPADKTDLGRTPKTAKDWPIKIAYSTSLDNVSFKDINPSQRKSEGSLHIKDNDLPNIMIRIESLKDQSRVYFPPIVEPAKLPIFNSSEFNKAGASPGDNAEEYKKFVGDNPEPAFTTSKLADPTLGLPMYFKVIDVAPPILPAGSPPPPSSFITMLNKFKDSTEEVFTRNHFTLECYTESDTALDGSPAADPDKFGLRSGVGADVVALLQLPQDKRIREDVEYKIDVWADDNVKWATAEGHDNVIAIPTGITTGELRVEIPNQYPKASHVVNFDKTKAVNGDLTVVFREPTPIIKGTSESDLIAAKFPFIEAKATDYSGLTRKIKIYLPVSNEKPNVRILERKHEKKP